MENDYLEKKKFSIGNYILKIVNTLHFNIITVSSVKVKKKKMV